MKIIEQSLTRLKVQHRSPIPWIISGIFILVGLLAILIFYQMTTFSCQRIQDKFGTCQLINTNVLGTTIKEIPIQSIEEVTLEETKTEEPTYRVVLMTKEEVIPLTSVLTSDLELYDNMISKIKFFLDNSKEKNLVIQKEDTSIIIVAIILIIIGIILFLFLANSLILEFDKKSGLMTIKKKKFFTNEVDQYQLQDILGLNWDSTKEKRSNRIMLLLSSGKQITLINDYWAFNKQNDHGIIRLIYRFLKTPSS